MQTLTQNELRDTIFKILEMVEDGEEILIRTELFKNIVYAFKY